MRVKTKFKAKFVATIVAIFMLICNAGIASWARTDNLSLDAYTTQVDISNGQFKNPNITASTKLPASPSNWTALQQQENVTAGVITLDTTIATDETIKNSYKLSALPREYVGMEDKQVLMINSGTYQASSGYSYSNTISMSSNGFYVVSFKAYTQQGTIATARLNGYDVLEKKENAISINTSGMWQDYKIYVQTSNLTSITPGLEFWLGEKDGNQSSGAVFFDKVIVNSYDNNTFQTMLKNDIGTGANIKYINLDKNYVPNFLKNADFEDELSSDNWTLAEGNSLITASQTINGRFDIKNFNSLDTKIDDEVTNTTIYGNQYALLINNLQKGYVGYKSAYFTLEKQGLYKLSFLAKTSALDGSATVKLVERNPYTNEFLSDGTKNPHYYVGSTYEAKTFEIGDIKTSTYTNELQNNWREYSFFIKANTLIDTELNLEIWLGTEDEGAKGYALFDNFTLTEITSNEYSANSSTGTVANLNSNQTDTDFKNSTFNLITIEDVADTAPYTPQDWSLSSVKANAETLDGIINTADDYTALDIPKISPIDATYPDNNVLMIGNLSSNAQTYTSSSLSLEANGYAKITVDVLTSQLNGASASITLVANSVILGEIDDIDTSSEWKTYTMFVKTGYQSQSVSLKLSLGKNSQGTGYAFFDNVTYKTSTEDEFDDSLGKKINLAKYDWTNSAETSTKGLFEPYDWSSKTQDNSVIAGIIDTATYGTENGYNSSALENPQHPQGENSKILMIQSANDTNYAYATNLSFEFASGSYYKVQVKIKTTNLGQEEQNKQYIDGDKKTKAYPFGASISLSGIDAKFNGIDTQNEWKTYTMYINCTTSSTVKLEVALGSDNAPTHGTVYVSGVEISSIDQSEYADGISVLQDDDTIDNILAVGNTDVANDDAGDDNTNANGTEFNWLLVPSLITGLAVVIAVVGAIWRKVRKSAPKKVKPNKPYSSENIERLKNSHKQELKAIDEAKQKVVNQQNNVAIKLNKARQENSDKQVVLENEYKNLSQKVNSIDLQKKETIEKFNQKMKELKELKKSEKQSAKK